MQLADDIGAVTFHGSGTDLQLGGHFFVALAFHQKLKDFPLAADELFVNRFLFNRSLPLVRKLSSMISDFRKAVVSARRNRSNKTSP